MTARYTHQLTLSIDKEECSQGEMVKTEEHSGFLCSHLSSAFDVPGIVNLLTVFCSQCITPPGQHCFFPTHLFVKIVQLDRQLGADQQTGNSVAPAFISLV